MCIRVRFAPRDQLEPWDAEQQIIAIPDELSATTLYTLRAVRAVLRQLGIDQEPFGARCWCGDEIELFPAIPQQRRSDEVIHLGA
ncbi:hypothetical protein [Streptomyces shenzhenensis]|uniref:Uncharacterized protein n=1 Tax=Streptomyces shenzhenensis TaxID=943815 RepID=A0A3M0I9P1_9ACTN|nr:hypothetical protein [Streptomyces shenzhenensis]RMB85585.1 hypothetical protein CTZ28_12390 [Streptomyces shenzhenensis]